MATRNVPAGGSGKTCVMCGEDVSAKPRTKDSRGRYFCSGCYEKAIALKHSKRDRTSPPKTTTPPATPASNSASPLAIRHAPLPTRATASSQLAADAFGLEEDDPPSHDSRTKTRGKSAKSPQPPTPPESPDQHEPSVLEGLLDLEPIAAAPPMICPSCRSSIPAGGTLCTICGYNMQTGATVGAPSIRHANSRGGGSGGAGGAAWPIVIGAISTCFGGIGALLYGYTVVQALMGGGGDSGESGQTASRSIGRIGGAMLVFSLAAWLLTGGIGILRRQSSSVSTLRRWAIVKLAVVGLCMLPFSIIAAATFDTAKSSGDIPPEFAALGESLIAYLLLLTAWMAFWPIFLLAWFGRAAVKSDVDAWD